MHAGKQKFRKTVIAQALITGFYGTALMAVGQQAFAQAAPSLERVEVTGSNIRRADTETSSPVQVITRDEIERSGKSNVAEYLQTLTSDGQGSVPATYGRGFAAGSAAGISLRGLGANATLVLVNGRRVAPAVLADDAQRTFVDLNTIPLEAVERVEVLKDGASSIYGSDAVAGVVNIILRKNFKGTIAKITYGISKYSDGNEPRAAITHGWGDMEKDGFNVLFNLEAGSKDAMYFNNRTDRGTVGVSALAPLGFDPNSANSNNTPRLGGQGTIPTNAAGVRVNNTGTPSIVGNVRNPTTLDYYSRSDPNGVGFTKTFPGAATYCANNTNLAQTNVAGGCITDLWRQFGQVVPASKNVNFFGRFSKQLNAQTELFTEVGLYSTRSTVRGGGTNVAFTPNGGNFTTAGDVISNTAASALGPTHPDNPYPGQTARLMYNPILEIGPRTTDSSGTAVRLVAGLKGTAYNWDYDTAITFSESKQTDTAEKTINKFVAFALLNPTAANVAAAVASSPAYAALPAGTFWRIGENASLNSQAMYNALLSDRNRNGVSRTTGIDFKASRELGKLDGGPIGVAVGAEYRKEMNNLALFDGLGTYIGLPLTAYSGERNISAAYTEALFPVTKRIEINGALRIDKYSDSGQSVTPKIGAKFRPFDNFAIRGSYSEGFRAPTATENSASSIAAFGGATVNDRARTAAGVPNQDAVAPTFVQRGNPSLKPEKSKSTTLGMVWDVTPKTSLTLDLWSIRRTGLPVLEDPQSAVDAGHVTRDPATKVNAADPGAILSGFVTFVNSAQSKTSGIDFDAKHRFDLGGGYGKLTLGATWTHMYTQKVIDQDGTEHEYAGTHGNCNITNCIGSPKDRISVNGTWDMGAWRWSATANYRGSMTNKLQASDTTCAFTYANGTDAPSGCKVASFMTVDLSTMWKFRANTELLGSIQNLFDKKPPFDPMTYGAIGYNPLDFSGAVGRYFRVGLRHRF